MKFQNLFNTTRITRSQMNPRISVQIHSARAYSRVCILARRPTTLLCHRRTEETGSKNLVYFILFFFSFIEGSTQFTAPFSRENKEEMGRRTRDDSLTTCS